MTAPTPNPGSPEAGALGCLCPALDNGHGRGRPGPGGDDRLFVMVIGCPIHTPTPFPGEDEP